MLRFWVQTFFQVYDTWISGLLHCHILSLSATFLLLTQTAMTEHRATGDDSESQDIGLRRVRAILISYTMSSAAFACFWLLMSETDCTGSVP